MENLSVFERGARGERAGLLFLGAFMFLLGGGGGLYLAFDDLTNGRVAKGLVKGGLLFVGGLAVLLLSMMKKYPGIELLRTAPGQIRGYSIVRSPQNTNLVTALKLQTADGRSLRLPLKNPEDLSEAETAITSVAPAARRMD